MDYLKKYRQDYDDGKLFLITEAREGNLELSSSSFHERLAEGWSVAHYAAGSLFEVPASTLNYINEKGVSVVDTYIQSFQMEKMLQGAL